MHDVPYGYCHCGCGQKTAVAGKTNRQAGDVRGKPRRFVHNHHGRKQWTGPEYIIDPVTGCWNWNRSMRSNGYGRSGDANAHRVYYERLVGPIADGLHIDHLCRNRACVNPAHLEPVSPAENLRRGLSAKITAEQAQEIRDAEGLPLRVLAARYGISITSVSRIRRNTAWII